MTANEQVAAMVEKARVAQKEFEAFSQQQVDEMVRAIGKTIYDNAEPLARMAVDETGMGRYEDKIIKNSGRAKAVWYHLKGVKSRGILRYIKEKGLVEVAKPMGVIGAIAPVTNPTVTPLHNMMVALKGGNAIIISPHPRGKKTGKRTVELAVEAITALGAPQNLIQIVEEPTSEISALVMQETDVCISTGGPGLVKVAYRSGKPAYGVGAGNVQCLVDRDVDLADAAEKIIVGRANDNGILCTSEQFVLYPREKEEALFAAFRQQGAHCLQTPQDIDKLRQTAFPDGSINKDLVGQVPARIAKAMGMDLPQGTRILVAKVDRYGKDELLAREKLFPVVAAYAYDDWNQAVAIAQANLDVEGKGHSVVIHSNTKEHIEYASLHLSVSRFAVNQAATRSLGGTLDNGLAPTGTLGCGSWGNNSISENLDYHHMINISRIAYTLPASVVPTDEEIWS